MNQLKDYSNINHTGCLLLCTPIVVQSSDWGCELHWWWLVSITKTISEGAVQPFQTKWPQNSATANNLIWSAICKIVTRGGEGAVEGINCKCLQWNLACVFNVIIQPGTRQKRNNKFITMKPLLICLVCEESRRLPVLNTCTQNIRCLFKTLAWLLASAFFHRSIINLLRMLLRSFLRHKTQLSLAKVRQRRLTCFFAKWESISLAVVW